MERNTSNGVGSNVHRELGEHSARLDALEKAMSEVGKDVREIRDTVTGVKGSWKVLVAIAALFSGVLAAAVTKFSALIFPAAGK